MVLSPEEGSYLVSVARRAVETAVVDGRLPRDDELPRHSEVSEGGSLRARRGAFVTLTDSAGALRGCIGLPYPVKPLLEAVVHAAVGAATSDPRFPAVSPTELASIRLEVSALTEPETMVCDSADLPGRVRVGTDGLIVSGMGTSGLLLPQVGSEMGLSPEVFLSLTCEKAGLPPHAWRTPGVEVRRFQAEVFAESAPRPAADEQRASL